MKKTVSIVLYVIIVMVAGLAVANIVSYYEKPHLEKYSTEMYRRSILAECGEMKKDLIKTMDSYIYDIAPSSDLHASAIFDACDEYGVDMLFVLSQAHLESAFGTTGVARHTNSVCNVGAYDTLKSDEIHPNHKYMHPDMSIRPYVRLLCSEYLVNGKTEKDMMINYVNATGKRYATSEDYEKRLHSIYKKASSFMAPEDTVSLGEKLRTYNKCKSLIQN